ncbi:MAG: RNA polymerase sigma factor [Planctomycetes bacterium]|nr:RNA polymerase sigma factor [Planctomycetota bacterium]
MRPIDAELAQRILGGDREALCAFSEAYDHRLRRFLSRILDDAAAVDDVVQEVMAKVLLGGPWFEGWTSSLVAWVFRLAHNAAMDHLRSLGIHQRAMLGLRRRISRIVVISPLQEIERREFQAAFEGEIRKLPEVYRTAFLLREVEELDYAEIAAVLGVGAKTVSTRIHRARRLLRSALEPWLEERS